MESRFDRITTIAGEPVPLDYDGPLDEVVAYGATVHLEAMGAVDYALIVSAGGHTVCLGITGTVTINWREDDSDK